MAHVCYAGGDWVASWMGGGVAWNRGLGLVHGNGWDCDAATAMQQRELSSCCHPSMGRAPLTVGTGGSHFIRRAELSCTDASFFAFRCLCFSFYLCCYAVHEWVLYREATKELRLACVAWSTSARDEPG